MGQDEVRQLLPAKRRLVRLDGEDVRFPGPELVPGPGIDEDTPPVALEPETPGDEPDAVPLVRRLEPLPERARHRAEHGAAVETEAREDRSTHGVAGDFQRRPRVGHQRNRALPASAALGTRWGESVRPR